MVHELEEVLPILADFAIDSAGVFDLAHEELLGGAGEGLDVVVRLQHHLRRNCSNKISLVWLILSARRMGRGGSLYARKEGGAVAINNRRAAVNTEVEYLLDRV